MKEYVVKRLVNATGLLSNAVFTIGLAEDGEDFDKERATVRRHVASFQSECEFLGLPMTVKAAARFVKYTNAVSRKELGDLLDEINSRFFDESSGLSMFYIEQSALAYYNKTDLFGEQFKTNFPAANVEVSEAGNCFAFDRYTASVFHLMRALEVVLRALFQTLGLPPLSSAGERNWNGILRQIKDKLDADKSIPGHDFYDSAYAFLVAAKNPMRNATMHVDAVYDEASASRLFDAIGAFMRHVATKLKEP